ncbi:hypothetical protein [Paenibacillus lutrae]|uniref:hypothetical protein n=1 Tax=Paenibacillus lutrae TaxID=2078573 RepID=UPI0012F951CE|nr:hypothetical protein [Paenibacillus lutrae]
MEAVPGRVHRHPGRRRNRRWLAAGHRGPPLADFPQAVRVEQLAGVEPDDRFVLGHWRARLRKELQQALELGGFLMDACAHFVRAQRIGVGDGQTVQTVQIVQAVHGRKRSGFRIESRAEVDAQPFVAVCARVPVPLDIDRGMIPADLNIARGQGSVRFHAEPDKLDFPFAGKGSQGDAEAFSSPDVHGVSSGSVGHECSSMVHVMVRLPGEFASPLQRVFHILA